MAKTFDPNRIGGGTVSLVRAADGTYSLKEEGFDAITSLNMIDLGEVAKTTAAAKTETAAEKTGTTTADQTKAAFMLPKQDKDDDKQPDTSGDMLQESAKKLSDSLQDVGTIPDRGMGQIGTKDRLPAEIAAPQENLITEIKSPTETVFGKSTVEDDQRTRQDLLPETKIESPSAKLSVQEKERRKPKFLSNVLDSLKGPMLKKDQTKFTSASERAALGFPGDKSEVAQTGVPDAIVQGQPALGIKTTQPGTTSVPDQDLEADLGTVARIDIKPAAKKTFGTSLKSAFKNIKTPAMMLIDAVAGEPTAVQNHAKTYFTDRGDGRIGGNPSTDLYAGMNRTSMFGNLEKAGEKRINRLETSINNLDKKFSRLKRDNPAAFNAKKERMTKQLNKFKDDDRAYKADLDKKVTTKRESAIMNQPGAGGDQSGRSNGKSIVCTVMYQTTGLEDWKKAMKIWYIYQKKYLTIQHQEGYHKLFKPFVKGMHKSNIIKAIGAHVAKHRTQHLKHIMFNSKPSLLGKIYNKILEPICYWVGKK